MDGPRLRTRGAILIACCALLLPPTGCEAEALAPLRVGINPWPGYEFLYLADEIGIYDELGLEVRIVEFDSLGDVRRAFERGQIDVMGCTLIELLAARRDTDRDPTVIFVPDYSNGGDVILARNSIDGVAGLRGKRVGVELGSLNVFVLARALEKNGLSIGDVELIANPQLEMPDAFAAGEIDAVVTYPPFLFEIEKQGTSHRIFSTRDIPREVIDVIVADARTVRERPDDLVLLLRGFHRAFLATRERPHECLPIMASREGITPEEFQQVISEEMRIVGLDEQEPYLCAGGEVDREIRAVDQVLHAVGQLSGASKVDGATVSHIARRAWEAERP